MLFRSEQLKFKKKLPISSLEAAICNVALFKSMKEREFKDEIYISYSEEGVILETVSEVEWNRANSFVKSFLNLKKIAILTYGYEKEVYEELIVKGLKDYTRKMKQSNQECPYINIIHYQKLRKSCEYMDKEKYAEPLKDWERKSKQNPNFAFLIVEPAQKFEDVKRRLLGHLLKKEIPLSFTNLCYLRFLHLFYFSPLKQEIKQNFQKKMIEVTLEESSKIERIKVVSEQIEEYVVKVTNYTEFKLDEYDLSIINFNKNLSKLGLEYISGKEIQTQIKSVKTFIKNSIHNAKGEPITINKPFQDLHVKLISSHGGQNYCLVGYKKIQKQKHMNLINKFMSLQETKNIQQLSSALEKKIICEYEQLQFISELNTKEDKSSHKQMNNSNNKQVNSKGHERQPYKVHKVCMNSCPYMVHQYEHIPLEELDTFLYYLEQLHTYYCTYLVRFYGIAIQYGEHRQLYTTHNHPKPTKPISATLTLQEKISNFKYFLIFDYHHRSIQDMLQNNLILDNFQVGFIMLQIIYLINFLHSHNEPRCLGRIKSSELYWPLALVLPYLGNGDNEGVPHKRIKNSMIELREEGVEGDVKLVGELMKGLFEFKESKDYVAENEEVYFGNVIKLMIKANKYERINLTKCMALLEELLVV